MQRPLFRFTRLHQALLCCVLSLPTSAQAAAPAGARPPGPPEVTIENLVTEALAGNPELNHYQAEIAAARGTRQAAGAWSNPAAEVTAGYKRSEERSGGDLLGEGVTWSASVSQTFEFPGRLALRKAIANRQIALAELGLEQFRASLAARVRNQAFRVLVAQQNVGATGDVHDRVQELLAVLVQRDPAGVTPLLEMRVIEATAVTLHRRATQAEQALAAAVLELNQLAGAPLQRPVRIAGKGLGYPPLPPLFVLLQVAATNNYELRLRQADLEQQGFLVQLSRNQRWPAVTLTPYVSQERAADQETAAGLGFSLPLPLWNRNHGETASARARLEQAQTLMQVTQRNLERQLTEQSSAYQKQLAEMTRWGPDAIAKFREAAELGDRHYRLGSLEVSTYLELQRQYLEALEAVLGTHADALESWQQIELLIGRPLAALDPAAGKEVAP